MKSLLYIFLLLLSPEVFAAIFDPPPTDQSVQMLGMIFGSNIGNVYLGGAPNPILGSIMEKFNFIIVTIGTVIVAYVGIMSTINTAQEGTAMGKKWSAVWVPMRSIAGMALMVPSPASGYSMIQVTVMWIILQGIGAADQIWLIALNGLRSGASAMAGIPPSTDLKITQDAKNLTYLILDAAICMEALNKFGRTGTDHINNQDFLYRKGPYIKHFSETKAPINARIEGMAYFGVEDPTVTDPNLDWQKSICGAFNVSGEAKQADFGTNTEGGATGEEIKTTEELLKYSQLIYETKQLAISSMLTVLKPLAEGIVDGTINRPFEGGAQNPPGYFKAANEAYISIMSGLIVPIDNLGSGSGSAEFRNALKIAEQKGWIVAGSYYFVFNKTLQAKLFEDAKQAPVEITPFPKCGPPGIDQACIEESYWPTYGQSGKGGVGMSDNNLTNFKKIPLTQPEMAELSQLLAYGNVFLDGDSQHYTDHATSLGFDISMAEGSNTVLTAFTSMSYEAAKGLSNLLQGHPGVDPLMSHAWFGRDLMIAAEVIWITVMAITIVMSLGFWPASFWTGGGSAVIVGIVSTVLGIVFPVLGMMWTFGAMLAIYAPLIPFMIFTTAAIGWLLTVIEAVIAAPLIALGLVTPSGDELGKLETALMILANIFLRPMLMIFGFLLAGRLFAAVVTLVDQGMLEIFKTINVGTIFAWIMMLVVYVSFIISCTNTCFSLIYALPDKILRWLGGPAETTDTSAVSQTKSSSQQIAGQVGQGGGSTGQQGSKVMASEAKQGAENSANQKRLAAINKGGGARPPGASGPSRPNGSF